MSITRFDLCGEWSFHSSDQNYTGAAHIPGTIHTNLLANNLIEDPFFGDNEEQQYWIGESEWVYRKSFSVQSNLLSQEHIELVCEGLDTIATVSLNGTILGKTENMFRRYSFDLKHVLQEGGNTLEIHFASAVREGQNRQNLRYVAAIGTQPDWRIDGGQMLRKEQCNFGWDWGPKCVTCGIWKPIYIEAWSLPRLGQAAIRQTHTPEKATIDITCDVRPNDKLTSTGITARLDIRGNIVSEIPLDSDGRGSVQIDNPELWWPNGWGDQPLYDLSLTLKDAAGKVLDQTHKRIGLRKLEVVREEDEAGRSFYFRVNDTPIFAKGANWIPADVFATRVQESHYDYLLKSARAAHMNMIRVWGGGIYESDTFYELCDQLGLLVWQDFMFACAAYPAFDSTFLANVREEAIEQVRRLRHHACIALFCGNNELEQFTDLFNEDGSAGAMTWPEYDNLFNELLPEVVRREAPDIFYWPSSAHSENRADNANDCSSGDVHYWGVWWGLQPFESYNQQRARFCSEFGFQSFPHPTTINACVPTSDHNLTSYLMDYRQRGKTGLGSGNGTILAYLSDHFRIPKDYANLLVMSQIVQGYGLKIGVEGWRMMRPHCMGALYWQLNDCWPAPSWSTIDSFGRWKASHYLAKRFFAPTIVNGSFSSDHKTLTVRAISDPEIEGPIELRVTATNLSGEVIGSWKQTAGMHGQNPAEATFSINASNSMLRQRLYWLEAIHNGEIIATDLAHGVKFKHLPLEEPGLQLEIRQDEGQKTALVTATRACALFVWLESETPIQQLADNFFHLRQGESRCIRLDSNHPEEITVKSLYQTYA